MRRGVDFLVSRGRAAEVVIVGASADAAAQLARIASERAGGSFGWYRFTLTRLAGTLASQALGSRGLTPAGPLPLEAICARIVHRLGREGLGRFAAIADRPGFLVLSRERSTSSAWPAHGPRSRRCGRGAGPRRLRRRARSGEHRRSGRGPADRDRDRESERARELVGKPIVLLDVPVRAELEGAFVRWLVDRSTDALVTLPLGTTARSRS